MDPTGLYKMGHRSYDPSLGRFTQPDPSGQEANPYLYAGGDPVNRIDPSGLLSISSLASKAKTWGKAAGKLYQPIATGCYIGNAVSSTDNSWSDEKAGLNKCCNPFSDYALG